MKTSRKLIWITTGFVLIVLVVFMVNLRQVMLTTLTNGTRAGQYKLVHTQPFARLDISSPMILRIRQGKECRVEYAGEPQAGELKVWNLNGTLYLRTDSLCKDTLHIRITMPVMHGLKASNGSRIKLENFQSDSVFIDLQGNCLFHGRNNTLQHVVFKTTGENTVDLSNIM